MAASIDNAFRLKVSRLSLKSTIFCQVLSLLFLCSSVVVLLTVDWRLNVIDNAVYSIRTFSIVYGIVQSFLYGVVLREKDADPVTYRSSNKATVFSKIPGVLKYTFLFSVSCIVLHVVIVLFGAAVQEVVEETFILAVLLSTLSTLPCLCVLGTNGEVWNRFTAQRRPHPGLETCIQYGAVASLLGAWMGAFTIPLDWDRPWQVWPVPCAIGALLGHTAGMTVGLIHLVSLSSKQYIKGKSKNFRD
ncbi:phosphatidylinositol-glycan biosynthesis class F protein-like [Acanthaster planci]|uniref:Phosphatidylinositol-glycan biosynthesis class F protein-like n=1 Tax=Acanthaster planci TaxID=133434 RepID=A0A8B7YQW5_ACAPL|nr:phosphatidylinositol-glycan biosynthesis class F protein-like [Acanthaster planci]